MTFEEFTAAISALDQEQLTKLLERRHPFYDQLTPHWNFLESTYEGGRDWFSTDNLFRFYKEGELEYKERAKRAYRPNHTREVVELVNKYVFKSPIARRVDDASKPIQSFWKSATLQRRTIDDLMRSVSSRTSVFGRIWVVVDSITPALATVADQKNGLARVYAYTVKPQFALDMAFTTEGDLNWILLQETFREDDLFNGSGNVVSRFRLWTQNFWALFELEVVDNKKTYVALDTGAHNLGVVPVFPADHIVSEELYWAPGLIDDSAYLDRAVANYLSNIDVIVQDQTFSQLVIPAQAVMPGDEGNDKVLEMGTKRMFTYDAQAGVPPSYISPDPRQASLILAIINKLVAEIYQTVGMSGERTKQDNATGIDNSSGVAKAYDFERMNAMLASKASSLEFAETRLIGLVRLYNGEGDPLTIFSDDETTLVDYPDNFDVRSLYDEFEIAGQLALIAAPDKVRQQQMETLIDKLFPGLSETLVQEIKDSVGVNWPAPIPLPGAQGAAPPLTGKVQTPKPASRQGQNNKD